MTKSEYQMTHYFVQPRYISELDYYDIFAISNTRITEHTWSSIKTDVSYYFYLKENTIIAEKCMMDKGFQINVAKEKWTKSRLVYEETEKI